MSARDPFARVVEHFENRDRKTTEEHGCPLSMRGVDGTMSCERAATPLIALAHLNAHVGQALKAASPLLLSDRRRATSGAFLIEVSPEEFHAFAAAIDLLRGDE